MATQKAPARTRPVGAKTVDEYLAQVDPPARAVLERMRRQIIASAPMAREVISYRIPTYLHHGPLLHFAVQPKHLALYVISPDVLDACKADLEPYEVSGRTVRFTEAKPLPAALVKKIVKMRVDEVETRTRR
jgi:uncharacterized protein YdhG (YjbR/CyaY superfamily)